MNDRPFANIDIEALDFSTNDNKKEQEQNPVPCPFCGCGEMEVTVCDHGDSSVVWGESGVQ